MKLKTLSLLFAGCLSFSALAQAAGHVEEVGEDGDSIKGTSISGSHHSNRNIAFASVIMGRQGADVTRWKAVNAFQFCVGTEQPEPKPYPDGSIPSSEESSDRESRGSNIDTECYREVLYTTHYELLECDDGRAYIQRAGEGITLDSNTEGSIFDWTESYACSSWPDGPSDSGTSTSDSGSDIGNAEAVSNSPVKLPLSMDRVVKKMR
ncbi:MAG: hypothetical protein R3B45_05575 [Bdellovibrionota bacterium]